MTGLNRKTSIAWAAGDESNPLTIATYRIQGLTNDIEKAIALAESSVVGEFQNAPARPGGRFMEFGFTTEVRGSDVVDVPPPDAPFLRACSFAEAENGSTPNIGWKYTLGDMYLNTGTPAGVLDPVDIDIYQDMLYRQAGGCVGSVIISFIAGQIPTFEYNWRGVVGVGLKGGVTKLDPPGFAVQANPKPVQSSGLNVLIARSGTVTGSVTGSTSETVLIDSSATFNTSGVQVGDAIAMDIGGETAVVISIQSETQLTSDALSAGGSYDSGEDYTITKSNLTASSLIVPSIVCNVGNIISPRPDISGNHGFAQPIHTGRQPLYTMVVEVPSLHTFNFEREYVEGTTLNVSWTHEAGAGDRHAMSNKFSGVINAMPVLSEGDGANQYTITMDQGIASGDDPLELSWQGT